MTARRTWRQVSHGRPVRILGCFLCLILSAAARAELPSGAAGEVAIRLMEIRGASLVDYGVSRLAR